jgi:acid phosphatase class B
MATISFDFDHTLWDEDHQCFIEETVALLRSHLENGDRVIIVTSRIQKWASEATELIEKHLRLHLQTFSCPGNADDWRCGERLKSDVLIAEGAVKHFDDIPDDSSLTRAKNNGIEILLPPAICVTNPVVTRMY